MSDQFYKDLRDDVSGPLIDEFGAPMTLRTTGAGRVVNEATGFVTAAGVDVDYPIKAVRTKYKRSEIDGTNIKDEDFQVLFADQNTSTLLPLGIVPDTSMRIVDSVTTYTIVRVEPVQPGNITVIYKMQVR